MRELFRVLPWVGITVGWGGAIGMWIKPGMKAFACVIGGLAAVAVGLLAGPIAEGWRKREKELREAERAE